MTPAEFRVLREDKIKQRDTIAFKAWKQRYQVDESQDDIIFGEDEEIHDGIKLDSIDDVNLSKQSTQLSNKSYGVAGKKDQKQRVISR